MLVALIGLGHTKVVVEVQQTVLIDFLRFSKDLNSVCTAHKIGSTHE